MQSKVFTNKWRTNKSVFRHPFKVPNNLSPEAKNYFYCGPSLHFGHVTKPKK